MTLLRPIVLPLVLLAFAAQTVLARVDVKIDFDKSFNFKSVRTWGWAPDGVGEVKMARTQTDNPEAMQKRVEPTIVEAVTAAMTRAGLQHAASNPDVTVRYFLLLTTNMQAQTVGQFLPGTLEWGLPLFPQATQSMKVLNHGALVLDLSGKGNVVWRGVAQAEIKMDLTEQKRHEKLREGVNDLLKRYPPKQ